MARLRSIKPQFFFNEELAKLAPLTRLFFIGLWTQCDREGRCEDRPIRLKANIMPYDECDVESILLELVAYGYLDRYSAGGKKVISVVNFSRHQRPHLKELPSELLPKPGNSGSEPVPAPTQQRPETLEALALTEALVEVEALTDTGFDAFWASYPNKASKKDARKAWDKLKPDAALIAKMMTALDAHKKTPKWTKDGGQYINLPASWIRGEKWEDEISSMGQHGFNAKGGGASNVRTQPTEGKYAGLETEA